MTLLDNATRLIAVGSRFERGVMRVVPKRANGGVRALRTADAALQCTHHERLAPATLNLSGCIVSPVRRPRLERGGRRFESCHPDHLQILPVRVRGGALSYGQCRAGHKAVLKTVGVRDGAWFDSFTARQWSVARVAMGRLAKPQPVGNRREGSIPSRSASLNTHNVL